MDFSYITYNFEKSKLTSAQLLRPYIGIDGHLKKHSILYSECTFNSNSQIIMGVTLINIFSCLVSDSICLLQVIDNNMHLSPTPNVPALIANPTPTHKNIFQVLKSIWWFFWQAASYWKMFHALRCHKQNILETLDFILEKIITHLMTYASSSTLLQYLLNCLLKFMFKLCLHHHMLCFM